MSGGLQLQVEVLVLSLVHHNVLHYTEADYTILKSTTLYYTMLTTPYCMMLD